ncbi:hypothetical protein GCK72_008858 [Caenorhabditis remanei]|uniref:Uncharacterized protein n=1 Tax=Caenorhabditis remanei TaxID=31234 RepID=A0A6A5H0T2_CAERE|nr:hypothetical protein GCK72_008858 [Caenorhabditis remanei]KAF1760609.1 hypothetical protein GCK72_008858 [Caenorhabditis remanei]
MQCCWRLCLSLTAEDDSVVGTVLGGGRVLLSLVSVSILLVTDVNLGQDLLSSSDIDNSHRDVSLVVVNVNWVPDLVSELGSLWEWNPAIVETTDAIRKMDKKLDRSDILAVLVVEPREVGSDLKTEMLELGSRRS